MSAGSGRPGGEPNIAEHGKDTRFQPGNKHSHKPARAEFRKAIMYQVTDASGDTPRLRKIAEQVLKKAETGDKWAIEFVRDSLDGRPAQVTVEEGANLNIGFSRVEFVVVKPHDDDAGRDRAEVPTLTGPGAL